MNKQQSKVRYSIRKVSIGILSISIGMFLALGMSNKAYADEIDKSKDFRAKCIREIRVKC